MSCRLCASGNQAEFPAEMMLHFRGLKNVDKPPVWIFPTILICLECGFSQFTAPKEQLPQLANPTPPLASFAQSNCG